MRYKLKELLNEKGYIRGPFGSALVRSELKEEGIPVYEQQHAIYHIRNFRFFIDEKKFQNMRRFCVQEDDLLISCSGTIGKVTRIKKNDPIGIISQALLLLRPNKTKVLPEFLKYFFESNEGYHSIVSRSSGSVQVNIAKREIIEGIELEVPELSEQQGIVNTLKSFDEKIELNKSINKNLEEMAQALFKRWFVDFEFPNENGDPYKSSGGEFVESELGLIPKGWQVSTIGELSKNIQYGYTQSSSVEEIGPKFLRITDIQNGTVEWGKVPFCSVEDKDLKKYRICEHDIFIARTGASTGENIYIIDPPEAVFASYLIRIQFIQPEVAFFIGKYMRRKEYFDYISFVKGGSAQPNANAKTLTSYKIVVPNSLIIKKYFEHMFPAQLLISKNQKENQLLAQTRDTLLPKLMSGEIQVPVKRGQEHLQTLPLAAESKAGYSIT